MHGGGAGVSAWGRYWGECVGGGGGGGGGGCGWGWCMVGGAGVGVFIYITSEGHTLSTNNAQLVFITQ